jgi:hypothetical protein
MENKSAQLRLVELLETKVNDGSHLFHIYFNKGGIWGMAFAPKDYDPKMAGVGVVIDCSGNLYKCPYDWHRTKTPDCPRWLVGDREKVRLPRRLRRRLKKLFEIIKTTIMVKSDVEKMLDLLE